MAEGTVIRTWELTYSDICFGKYIRVREKLKQTFPLQFKLVLLIITNKFSFEFELRTGLGMI